VQESNQYASLDSHKIPSCIQCSSKTYALQVNYWWGC